MKPLKKNKLPLRLCEVCKAEFQPTREWSKYCSHPCRTKAFWTEHRVISLSEVEVILSALADSTSPVAPVAYSTLTRIKSAEPRGKGKTEKR